MGSLTDFVDDWVLGPFNLIDRLEGFLTGVRYQDLGYEFSIPRTDKGGSFSLNEVRELLKNYGVDTYGRRFDSQRMYFRVKKRQASWAEYILLNRGVELLGPTFDRRNLEYVGRHPAGWMPTPWKDRAETRTEEKEDVRTDNSGWSRLWR
jgi:hypothetical protein